MSYKYQYIEFEQPAGTFLLTVVPAEEILKYFTIHRREYINDKPSGTQRDDSLKRVKEIADYVKTFDATFPTSIILALQAGQYTLDKDAKIIEITGKAEVIDGQHRIEGLELAGKTDLAWVKRFTLPCVFIIEPVPEEKAFIFATINGKQNKVNASLVYDLFGTSSTPDPYNILHKLARTLNFKTGSPFQDRLKMLGKKTDDKVTESLTQGTFIEALIPKISASPSNDRELMKQERFSDLVIDEKRVLREYMRQRREDLLVSLFENIFNAVKKVWPDEWENHNKYILSKTTGYLGIMKAIDEVIIYGKQKGLLSQKFFEYFFEFVKEQLITENVKLVKEDFPPGGVGENKLRDYLKAAYMAHYPLSEEKLQSLKE